MILHLVILVVLLGAVHCDQPAGTLLDDSEYRKFVQFDEMLSSVVAEVHNGSSDDGVKSTLNFANIAMMFYQRSQRWKQGGNAESLHYINFALHAQKSAGDAAHSDQKLFRSMLLHKAIMLLNLGQREASRSVIDSLLDMRIANIPVSSPRSHILHMLSPWSSTKPEPINDQELSSILYYKAELLLSLYDDFSTAVSLFKEALSLYPCNYRAYLQLVHAMKASKSVTQMDWLTLIAEMEQYLLNIRQRASNTKTKYKYKPPPIEYRLPYGSTTTDRTHATANNNTSISDTVQGYIDTIYSFIRRVVNPTTHICTFSSTDSGDAASLYGATTSQPAGSSQHDTTLSGIYASVNWALFVAADSFPATGDPGVDANVRNMAWKYLQQARHFDRQSINEQHLRLDYQQRVQNEEHSDSSVYDEVTKDMLPEGVDVNSVYAATHRDEGYLHTISSSSNDHNPETSQNVHSSTTTLGEVAVRKMTDHSAAQVKHLTQFFKKGYWGNTEHYENYTAQSTVASIGGSTQRDGTYQAQDESGRKTRIPIFIVGFFRSGSTLLESLLETNSGYVRLSHPTNDTCKSTIESSGGDTTDNNNHNSSNECQLVAELGYRLHSVWGMGENSPFVFDMYAMQEETLVAFDTLEKQRTALQKKYAKKKNSNKQQQEESKLEEAFMRRYDEIIDNKATTIVGKMQKAFVDMHSNIHSSTNTSNNTAAGTNNSILPTHIVDKMLTNYVNIGLIHMVFPKAIILHTIRDPMDTLYSCFSTRFGDPGAVYTLHTDTLVQKYVQYLEVMQHFREVLPYYTLPRWNAHRDYDKTSGTATPKSGTETQTVTISVADTTSTPTMHTSKQTKGKAKKRKRIQALVDVRYEELVANPERVIRYILQDILGVPYVPSSNSSKTVGTQNDSVCTTAQNVNTTAIHAALNPIEGLTSTHTRVVNTASRLQVKQPVYASSVGRWLKYKSQLQQSLIPAWQQYVPYLASINALPYADPAVFPALKKTTKRDKCKVDGKDMSINMKECVYMNWNCSELYNYSQTLVDLQ